MLLILTMLMRKDMVAYKLHEGACAEVSALITLLDFSTKAER